MIHSPNKERTEHNLSTPATPEQSAKFIEIPSQQSRMLLFPFAAIKHS